MPRRKAPVPFGEYVRSLNLELPNTPEGSDSLDERPTIPKDFQMSSLLPGQMGSAPEAVPPIKKANDFPNAMLRAVKELNQNPELLREVSKRSS